MRIALTVVLLLFAYLLAWPVNIDPQPWSPPPAPSLSEGLYAQNDRLVAVQRLIDGGVAGPEAVSISAEGRLIAGLADGRVISAARDGSDCRVLANTGGRPLGLQALDSGRVVVADALKGLVEIHAGGTLKVLSQHADGIPLGFTDDLDVDSAGRVYFSDASWKFGYGDEIDDALEHVPHGRLLRYDPASGEAYTLLADLYFANGVALGPNEDYVLINETTRYRITRFWLKGDKVGQREIFIDNLPGLPDNISFNGRDRFWVALYSPRSAALDAAMPYPFVRSLAARLPRALTASLDHRAFILGLDLDGRVVEQYQATGRAAYAPITHVQEVDGQLYLGSLTATAIGRVSLDVLRGGGSIEAPPALPGTCAPQA